MRRLRPTALSFVTLVTLITPVRLTAQDAPPKRLDVTASLGASQNEGNASAASVAIADKITWTGDDWILKQDFGLFYGEANEQVAASLATAGLRAERILRPWIGAYASVRFDRNGLQGIARRFEESVGVDLKPLRSERDKLSIVLGASLFQQTFTSGSTSGSDGGYPAIRAAFDYKRALGGAAYLQQLAEWLPNLSESAAYLINTETVAVAPLSQRFALKLSYAVRYNNAPPFRNDVRLQRTDRFFSTTLTYTY